MKIAFFRALVAGLLLITAPVFTVSGQAQYGTPQVGSYYPGTPQFNIAQGNYVPGQAVPAQAQPQVRIPRYPLNQNVQTQPVFTPTPGYVPANRNAIQQPQYYSGNAGVASQNGPGAYAPGIQAPGIQTSGIQSGFRQPSAPQPPVQQQSVPHLANHYNAYPYRYQEQDAPTQDPPVSPSNLPIPGGYQNQNIEQLQPGQVVQPPHYQQPVDPHYQHAMPHQQGLMYPQQDCQQLPQNGPGMAQPYADPAGSLYSRPGIGSMAGAGFGGGSIAGYNSGFGMGIGGCGIVPPAQINPGVWFGSLGGLVFNRDFEDDHVYAYPIAMPTRNSLVSTDADPGAMGGLEATFGRRFCNGLGLQVVYWGLFSEDGIATASGGNPQTPWRTTPMINYHLNTMDVYLNAALAYRLIRTNEFHNVELNFFRTSFGGDSWGGGWGTGAGFGGVGVGGAGFGGAGFGGAGFGGAGFGGGQGAGLCGTGDCGGCGNAGSCGGSSLGCGSGCGPAVRPFCCRPRIPFRFDVLAGVRFFRFDENLFFHASTTGDYMPNINDMNYDIDVTNNLVGLQLGGNVEYCLFPRWTLVGGTRFGIYGNSISQTQRIYGLAGYAVPNTGAWAGQDFNHRSTKTDVAFLGQLDLGVRYAINCRWGLGFGYRVMSVSGVALAPEQIPYNLSNYQEVNYINSNGGLILHGAYLRAQYNF